MSRFALACAIVTVAACGASSGGLVVTEARIGQPTGPNAALYFTATADVTDRLIGARTDFAASVEVHETTMDDDGTMRMQPVTNLELPAGETLVLEPGGYHLMLIDAERMDIGDTVAVTLTWETAGDMLVEATVLDPADTVGHDHGG